MAYELRIERSVAPILLEEWLRVVAAEPDVRIAPGDLHIQNPDTNEAISIPQSGGDADLFLPDHGTWERVFYWSPRGSISFVAPDSFTNPNNPIRRMSQILAQRLGAQVVGEEDETYI